MRSSLLWKVSAECGAAVVALGSWGRVGTINEYCVHKLPSVVTGPGADPEGDSLGGGHTHWWGGAH